MKSINIAEKFSLFNDHWSPKIIAELNGQQIKLAKVKGEFVWHNHQEEEELFFVMKGQLKIMFTNETVTINEGEMFVVPRGVEHKPVAEEEVLLMLFEPKETKHTGEVESDLTVKKYDYI